MTIEKLPEIEKKNFKKATFVGQKVPLTYFFVTKTINRKPELFSLQETGVYSITKLMWNYIHTYKDQRKCSAFLPN